MGSGLSRNRQLPLSGSNPGQAQAKAPLHLLILVQKKVGHGVWIKGVSSQVYELVAQCHFVVT